MIWARQGNSTNRVLRGGAWNNNANNARCAARNNNTPSNTNNNYGFRCVRRIRERVRALQAERARTSLRAASEPKAHLPPPVSAPRGNEQGTGTGAGSRWRTSRCQGAVWAVVLAMVFGVCGGVFAVGTYDESPVFAFDTRDSNSSHYADSALFAFDTRDSNSTHYAQSAVFAFNTRGFDGLSGNRASGAFSFDTRSTTATGLTIVGPSSLGAGSQAEYRIVMNAPGGGATDVTIPSLLGFVGSSIPTWAGIGGTTLFVQRTAPAGASMTLQARYRNGAGQVVSALKVVSISSAFFAGMTATAQHSAGTNYTITLDGRTSGGTPLFTFRWDTDGDGAYDDATGQHATFSRTSVGGTVPLKLEVTDAAGVKAYATGKVTLDKPPVANEPTTRPPTRDIGAGQILGANGQGLNFDLNKRDNGFIVLTHGLYTDPIVPSSWIVDMAKRIEDRLPNDPNVAIYDWAQYTNLGDGPSPYAVAALDMLGAAWQLRGLLYVASGGLGAVAVVAIEIGVKYLIKRAFDEATGTNFSAGDLAYAADFMVDAIEIRSFGERVGAYLGAWIHDQGNAGFINPDKPVHLVGHSAGGFVVGECALWLSHHPLTTGPYQGKRIVVDRVTMLDTPFIIQRHLTVLPYRPSAPVVERFNSSVYGGAMQWPSTFPIATWANYQSHGLGTWYLRLDPYTDGHGLSYRWYAHTIVSRLDDDDADLLRSFPVDGFDDSPLITQQLVPRPWALGGAALALAPANAPPPPIANVVSGFTAFGNVAEAGANFTITESANAGITRQATIPIGAFALRFRFKFAGAGDGDFLSVTFAEQPLYTGVDTQLSRGGFTEMEAALEGLDGRTGTLAFTLVSRGSANAVVEIADIEFLISDDPDGDGLTTTQEQAAGTNPLLADTDGDRLNDNYESSVSHTNPLLADSDGDGVSDFSEIVAGTNSGSGNSVFSIKSIAPAISGGVALSWTGRGGSTYRVLRSATPDFASFDVAAAAVPGVAPLTSYTDATVDARQLAGMFYRVEVAEAPAYAANMSADSDGDGIPDGWELDRGFNADLAADALLDSDSDGSSTLLEFALGTDPRVNGPDGIEIITDENGYLTLTTNRNPAATALQFRIAVSGDLAAWYSDAAHVTILANTPALLKARDNIPLGSAARRFIRLEVGK